jgi:hypothetical protein
MLRQVNKTVRFAHRPNLQKNRKMKRPILIHRVLSLFVSASLWGGTVWALTGDQPLPCHETQMMTCRFDPPSDEQLVRDMREYLKDVQRRH